jgi:hypothetical protein
MPGHQEKDQYKENPTPTAGVVSSKKSPPAGLMLTLVHHIGYVNLFVVFSLHPRFRQRFPKGGSSHHPCPAGHHQ